MSETCTEAECAIDFNILYQAVRNSSLKAFGRMGRSESIASSAVKTSIDLKAKALVVCSESGATAQQVAKFRPGRKYSFQKPVLVTLSNFLTSKFVFASND